MKQVGFNELMDIYWTCGEQTLRSLDKDTNVCEYTLQAAIDNVEALKRIDWIEYMKTPVAWQWRG